MLIFEEKQRFRQWWIWLLFAFLNVNAWIAIFSQLILHKPDGNNPMSDSGLIITAIMMFLFSLFFFSMNMKTRIDKESISLKFFPFHRNFKKYEFKDIKYCFVRKYSPILEYGGWGLRGISNNIAFNVSGNTGLQIELNNGKKILIGTQNADMLKKFLEENGLQKGGIF